MNNFCRVNCGLDPKNKRKNVLNIYGCICFKIAYAMYNLLFCFLFSYKKVLI